MTTYNPLAEGDIEWDHWAEARGSKNRNYFKLTACGLSRRSLIEKFFATRGWTQPPAPGLFRRTHRGYSCPKGSVRE